LGVVKGPTFVEVVGKDGSSVPLGKVIYNIAVLAFFYAVVGGAVESGAEFLFVKSSGNVDGIRVFRRRGVGHSQVSGAESGRVARRSNGILPKGT
jgi:hypothetical protein